MAQAQLWTAAFVVFLAWFATCVLAFIRSTELTSSFAKALCWGVPMSGLMAIAGLVFEAFFGEAGGYRGIAMGFISLVLYALAPLLLLAQIIAGAIATRLDTDHR